MVKSLDFVKHVIIDFSDLVNQLDAPIRRCKVSITIHSGTRVQVDALVRLLPWCLTQIRDQLLDHIQFFWLFAAYGDNIHTVAQIVECFGQVVKYDVEDSGYGKKCVLKPASTGYYMKPFFSDEKKSLQGVTLYQDH